MTSKEIPKERILVESRDLHRKFNDNLASRELNDSDFKISMKSQYSYLFNNFEPIFNISCSKSYDYQRLATMLGLAEKVKNDEISEHDASVKVGQILVDQIVKPQLDAAGVKPDKKN
tara:strand:+ start:1120 stop:1470 length:351 start_codon:yes stop_codon:yes gene_type:complete